MKAARRADIPAGRENRLRETAHREWRPGRPRRHPVFDGCGPYGHRGPYGHCRPGGQAGGYIRGVSCPAGWHIEPHGRFCLLNKGPILGPSSGGLY